MHGFSIFFESFFGVYVYDRYVGYVWMSEGAVMYYAFDFDSPFVKTWHYHKEQYEQTRRFLDARSGEEASYWNQQPAGTRRDSIEPIFEPPAPQMTELQP